MTKTNVQDAIDILDRWTAGEMLTDSEEFRIIWRELEASERTTVVRRLNKTDLIQRASVSRPSGTDILDAVRSLELYKRRCASDVDAFGKTIHPYVRKVRT